MNSPFKLVIPFFKHTNRNLKIEDHLIIIRPFTDFSRLPFPDTKLLENKFDRTIIKIATLTCVFIKCAFTRRKLEQEDKKVSDDIKARHHNYIKSA